METSDPFCSHLHVVRQRLMDVLLLARPDERVLIQSMYWLIGLLIDRRPNMPLVVPAATPPSGPSDSPPLPPHPICPV